MIGGFLLQANISEDYLPIYEALDSKVRLRIINLLSKNKMSMSDLANELHLSNPIISMHVKKLEKANIVRIDREKSKKIASLRVDTITIDFPKKIFNAFNTKETSIPIGHYTSMDVHPTCGLATKDDFLGNVDEPKYFMDPRRMDAKILWFTTGFVEYQTPNYIDTDETIEMLEISFEISSEFPFSNNNWPSDITFYFNDIELGTWTSPGDFSDTRGKLTPKWYPDNLNQYGLLKTLRISKNSINIDGEILNDKLTLADVLTDESIWKFRIEVKEDAANPGGCTLFGDSFGNYAQNIVFKTYYS